MYISTAKINNKKINSYKKNSMNNFTLTDSIMMENSYVMDNSYVTGNSINQNNNIGFNDVPIGWSIEAADFINQVSNLASLFIYRCYK